MSGPTKSTVEDLRALVTQGWRDAVSAQDAWWRDAARSYTTAVEKATSTTARTAAGSAARVAGEEALRYWRELAESAVEHATAFTATVNRLNRAYAERLARAVADPTKARRIEAVLRGPLGGEAVTKFVIANPQPDAVTVHFDAGILHSSTGEVVAPEITITPPTLHLRPAEEQTVTVRIALDGAGLAAGHTYEGAVAVVGSEKLEVALVLTVDPSTTSASSAPAAPTASRARGSSAVKAVKAPTRRSR